MWAYMEDGILWPPDRSDVMKCIGYRAYYKVLWNLEWKVRKAENGMDDTHQILDGNEIRRHCCETGSRSGAKENHDSPPS